MNRTIASSSLLRMNVALPKCRFSAPCQTSITRQSAPFRNGQNCNIRFLVSQNQNNDVKTSRQIRTLPAGGQIRNHPCGGLELQAGGVSQPERKYARRFPAMWK